MMTITIGIVAVKGGAGSGNWGHAGRPGMVGGSASAGGIEGRPIVGTYFDTDVHKVSSSEVTADRIDDWFDKEGNEDCGLLFMRESDKGRNYFFLSRDVWSDRPGMNFRTTTLSEAGKPLTHSSYSTAAAARRLLEFRLTPGPESVVVGGVWT